jgi:PAS domain S-box-containing protein
VNARSPLADPLDPQPIDVSDGLPWATELLVDDLLEAVAVPAWLHRGAYPLRANSALKRLSGLSLAALQHTAHLAMVLPQDRRALADATDQCLRGDGQPPALELRLATAGGGVRRVELTLRRVHWGGNATALVTCVDQTDIQHVHDSLQAMTGLLRQIVDGAPVPSFVIDREHRVTHWNVACEQLTGCAASSMVGTCHASRAFYAEDRPMLADLILDGTSVSDFERYYDGSVRPSGLNASAFEAEAFFAHLGPGGRWLHFNAAPLHDAQGVVIGAIETLQDVTLRRRVEEELTRHRQALEQLVEQRSAALAASARELEAFIDNAPIGVVYTAGGKVLRTNHKLDEIFGFAAGAAGGMPASDFYCSEQDHAELGRIALPALSQGLPLHHEMWMRHSSGRPIWMQLSAYVADHRNTAAGAWWMLQDRTEVRSAQDALKERFVQLQETNRQLEEAQNQLLQSEKMASIGQLAAGVAHEINNPVAFVSSNLHTLRQYVGELLTLVDAFQAVSAAPDDTAAGAALAQARQLVAVDYLKEDLPQLLSESADGLARVKKIVQDLKDFSRVDHADWQEADLNAGLESTLNVVRHELKYKAEVVKHLAPLPLVTCLAGQLNQVFMNLIVNASQAIGERGVITLSSGTEGDWVWVQVDDDGCGMTDDVRRRIFEPFYTTKEVGKGTGLGLSLSFAIVQRHCGAHQVRSRPGQGSAFRVWVPISGPGAGSGAAGVTGAGGALPPAWPEDEGRT